MKIKSFFPHINSTTLSDLYNLKMLCINFEVKKNSPFYLKVMFFFFFNLAIKLDTWDSFSFLS